MINRRFSLPTRALACGFALLALAACGKKEDPYVERPVEELYNGGMDQVAQGDWGRAAKNFEEVERQHPYSVWATRSQLMSAYSFYQANKYDDAILAAQRFIQLHPGNRDIAYAYYLVAISYYEQITDVGRDQGVTENALKALDEVVRRFPNTEYARDARLKIDLTRDHLAGKEMEIGRFYQGRALCSGAINRFKVVVEGYQTTSQVPEALHRITECYISIGVVDEARKSASVLGYNYPGSEWYADSFYLLTGEDFRPASDRPGWFTRTWRSIF